MRAMRRYLILTLVFPLLALGLMTGCGQRIESTPEAAPIPEPMSDWGSHWDEAVKLHRAGEFYAALTEYDTALELMPKDSSMIAILAGTNISKGECCLMLFDGWQAQMCSREASYYLEQATEYEKQGFAWNLMSSQALLINVASLIYIPGNEGQYPYQEAKELLERLLKTQMPEVTYFLGIVNDKLSNYEKAKSEFEDFISAPDELVTFLSGDTMRERAKEWLE